MDWCKGGDVIQPTHKVVSEKRRPKTRKVRCPICNKYLKQQIRECGDIGSGGSRCWHVKVPPHKAKK